MTKIKQFTNEFDVLYSRENSPRIGEHRTQNVTEHSPRGILDGRELAGILGEARRKQGSIG